MMSITRSKILKLFFIATLLIAAGVVSCSGDQAASSRAEDTALLCQDGSDNDSDGLTDCDDADCQVLEICQEEETDSDVEPFDGPGELLTNVSITRIDLCQTVCVPLMVDFEEMTPDIPLIPGKPALLRIYLQIQVGWDYRSAWSKLHLKLGFENEYFEEQFLIEESSVEANLDSTLNYVIPADYMVNGLKFAFSLHEDGAHVDPDGDHSETMWPASSVASIPMSVPEEPLELVLVPVRYNADGSGRLPDLSDEHVDGIRNLFMATYPLQQVNVTIREPFDWDYEVAPDGTGWDSLLMAITQLRDTDNAAYDQYYYGLFVPMSTLSGYCGGGCVLGLSHLVTEPNYSIYRASIGIGYTGGWAAETMIHEVGHAHGLGHAPCGATAGVDENFPYPDGIIGVSGYDYINGSLKSQGLHDFMSYCDPNWVSDYHYQALHTRISQVNGVYKNGADRSEPWSTIVLGRDGTATLGPALRPQGYVGGERRVVEFLDESGATVETVTGYFTPFDHFDGGTVLFPTPGKDIAAVRLDDRAPLELQVKRD